MKLTIDRDTLVDVLYRVQGVCAQKSTLPILASCLLEAHPDGRLEVHGTDLDISVSTSCAADVDEGGKVALAARRLFDTVKKMPSGTILLETESNHWANITAGDIHARMAGSHPDEFPQLPVFEEAGSIDLPTGYLLDMIEKTYFSISTDEARASFMGAFLQLGDDSVLQMVSTDGHRLSRIERALSSVDPSSAPAGLLEGMIVPRKGLSELRRVIPPDGTMRLTVKDDDLLFSHEGTRVSVRLIPGRFPNFAQVIPQTSDHPISVSRDALLQALKRASDYTAKTGNTRLTTSPDMLEVHAFDPDIGELKEPITCRYSGGVITAGYNYKYLQEVLSVIEGDEVVLEITNTESPTILRDPARPEVLYIVMPMQF